MPGNTIRNVRRFPESYQGSVARKFLANREPVSSVQFYITSSVLMSRFNHYNAPFVMSEIMNHWGDYASFSTVNGLLGTSKERGLRFNEFILKRISIPDTKSSLLWGPGRRCWNVSGRRFP